MNTLLGIDFGTGGCKVTAIDADGGALVAEASVEYPTYHDHPGWSEQDPADWWNAMCAALAKLRERGADPTSVKALALDGSTHNAVLLGSDWKPLRRTIMWTDQRSTAECAALRENGLAGRIFERCYQMPAPTWTLPQLMWLRANEPDALARTAHVLFVKDYVRLLLTGEAATDYIEAQGTLFFDMAGRKWDEELLHLAGLRPGQMPVIIAPADVAGQVTVAAAAETGIPVGTPVVCGTSDSAVEDYGAGAVEPGDLIVKLATAGNVNSMTAEAHPHPRTLTYSHVVPGMWYSVSATNAAALCMRWLRDAFYKDTALPPGGNLYALIDKEAGESPAGAGGVIFHPYLQGERCPYWDASLRASFTGVSISSTRGDFARALMEGVAFSLRDCYRTLEEMRLPANRIFLIGGGARSNLWGGIVANVFNRTVSVPRPGDASFGAALLAGVGAGIFPDARAAVAQCLRIGRTIAPDPGTAAMYGALFERYRLIHDALAPVYAAKR